MTDRSRVSGTSPVAAVGDVLPASQAEAPFLQELGRYPNLDAPSTFNDRVLHRLLHDRDRRLNILSDKIAVKDFVAERVGPQYVVPLLGKWKRARDIDWQSLPDRFVLKPNQTSGPFAMVHGAALKGRQAAQRARQPLVPATPAAVFPRGVGVPRRTSLLHGGAPAYRTRRRAGHRDQRLYLPRQGEIDPAVQGAQEDFGAAGRLV